MANSQLNFGITQGSNCDSITFCNESEYCIGPSTYTVNYCRAFLSGFEQRSPTSASFLLYGGVNTTANNIISHSWVFGAQTDSSQNFNVTLTLGTTNIITYTVVDDNGLTSTCTIHISLHSSGQLLWVAGPQVGVAPNAGDIANGIFNTIIYDSSNYWAVYRSAILFDFGDSSTSTNYFVNHTYASVGTYTISNTITEDRDLTNITSTIQLKFSSTSVECAAELTEDDIEQVVLKITDPDGTIETIDITERFLNSPFPIEQTELTTLDFSNSGIWRFQVILTKDNGTTYTFVQTKNIVIFCDIKCKYAKLLLKKTGLSSNCQDCDEITLNQIFNIDIYLSGLKDLIACNNTEGINNAITILEALVANTDCSCD